MNTSATSAHVLLVGPPNAGKSTLFNRLTGAAAETGNFAGTTVSVTRASHTFGPFAATLVDLPGTASIVANAADEEVTLRALLDLAARSEPSLVLLVLDGPRLSRSLYLALQVLSLDLPVVIAVNLMDEARSARRVPDVSALSAMLGVPVVAVSARTGEGMKALEAAVSERLQVSESAPHRVQVGYPQALMRDVEALALQMPGWATDDASLMRQEALVLWALQSEEAAVAAGRSLPVAQIDAVREAAEAAGRDMEAEIIGARYAWIDARLPAIYGDSPSGEDVPSRRTDAIDRVLLHPLSGALAFFVVMWLVFLALFRWSDPMIGAVEAVVEGVGAGVGSLFADAVVAGGPNGIAAIVRDLLVEGVIGGVGAVLVFLPQIAMLFLLLALLEDCGYLARAAALMDRILTAAGLPGKAFVPLLSGYACAVPAILATRSIPRFRDRLLTMLVVPLTSCSARLPVYVLMIGALFPPTVAGFALPMRPTVLMGMYIFSTVVTVGAAVVLGRWMLPAEASATVLELPPYRIPDLRNVLRMVWVRTADFVREAGRVILVATIVLWALLSFPRYDVGDLISPEDVATLQAEGADVDAIVAGRQLAQSYGGTLGKLMEPAIAPLGYDWKIGVGLVGAFAAREVFVSTMGVVYGISDADEEHAGLRAQMREARHADGTPVWTPLTGISVMVFFALAMQCLSTLAVLRKETHGWRWPAFVAAYMTALAWIAAFVVYQGGRLMGFV